MGAAAVAGVLLIAVLVVVGNKTMGNTDEGFSLGRAHGAVFGASDFDNPMHSAKQRNVAFDNPVRRTLWRRWLARTAAWVLTHVGA